MSTRSNIIIEVPDSFLNSTAKYNAEMFKDREIVSGTNSWGEETCPDKAQEILITKPYLGIYCHWDGYIAGVGQELVNNYGDFSSAFNLILGGDCSSISIDGIKRYATRASEEWKYIQPRQLDEPWYCTDDADYLYVFRKGSWYYINSDEEWIKLPSDIEDLDSYVQGYEAALETI